MVTTSGAPLPVGVEEPVRTLANAVTLVRTVIAVVLGMVAITEASLWLVAAGYAVYWVGDIADGAAARWLDEETRHGAVFDVVADRACTCVLAAGFVMIEPSAALALTAFLLQFMVLDSLLTLSFLHWPLVSPNEFHRVDRTVWRLNWSPAAKAANTAAVVLALAAGWFTVAAVLAVAVVVLKTWSLRRVLALITEGREAAPRVG